MNEVARSESYCYKATVNLMEDFTSVLYLDTLKEKEKKEEVVCIEVISKHVVYLCLDQFERHHLCSTVCQ